LNCNIGGIAMESKKEKLIKELKEQVEKIKKFQIDFKKNLPDENNMNSSDLRYMNGQVERMMMEHERIIGEYYKFKEG
tara:strand:- start:568 stop:801 length:234 start_codon:yes stop_codon:yes gene_type:complete